MTEVAKTKPQISKTSTERTLFSICDIGVAGMGIVRCECAGDGDDATALLTAYDMIYLVVNALRKTMTRGSSGITLATRIVPMVYSCHADEDSIRRELAPAAAKVFDDDKMKIMAAYAHSNDDKACTLFDVSSSSPSMPIDTYRITYKQRMHSHGDSQSGKYIGIIADAVGAKSKVSLNEQCLALVVEVFRGYAVLCLAFATDKYRNYNLSELSKNWASKSVDAGVVDGVVGRVSASMQSSTKKRQAPAAVEDASGTIEKKPESSKDGEFQLFLNIPAGGNDGDVIIIDDDEPTPKTVPKEQAQAPKTQAQPQAQAQVQAQPQTHTQVQAQAQQQQQLPGNMTQQQAYALLQRNIAQAQAQQARLGQPLHMPGVSVSMPFMGHPGSTVPQYVPTQTAPGQRVIVMPNPSLPMPMNMPMNTAQYQARIQAQMQAQMQTQMQAQYQAQVQARIQSLPPKAQLQVNLQLERQRQQLMMQQQAWHANCPPALAAKLATLADPDQRRAAIEEYSRTMQAQAQAQAQGKVPQSQAQLPDNLKQAYLDMQRKTAERKRSMDDSSLQEITPAQAQSDKNVPKPSEGECVKMKKPRKSKTSEGTVQVQPSGVTDLKKVKELVNLKMPPSRHDDISDPYNDVFSRFVLVDSMKLWGKAEILAKYYRRPADEKPAEAKIEPKLLVITEKHLATNAVSSNAVPTKKPDDIVTAVVIDN